MNKMRFGKINLLNWSTVKVANQELKKTGIRNGCLNCEIKAFFIQY